MRMRILGLVSKSAARAQADAYHADEEPGLLRGTPHTGVSNDANGEPSGETSETDGETGAELDESLGERHVDVNCACKWLVRHIRVRRRKKDVRLLAIRTETTRP
jgi:hypothetical protein